MLKLQFLQAMSRKEMVAQLRRTTADTVVSTIFAEVGCIPAEVEKLHRGFLAISGAAKTHFPQLAELEFWNHCGFPHSPLLQRIFMRCLTARMFTSAGWRSKGLVVCRKTRAAIRREAARRFSGEELSLLRKLAQQLKVVWRQ